jgi:hypothetical protein
MEGLNGERWMASGGLEERTKMGKHMGVWQGVAMDSLKFHSGPLCPTLLCPAVGPPHKRPYSRFKGGPPTLFRKLIGMAFFRSQVLLKSSEIPEFRNNLAAFFLIILNSEEKIQFHYNREICAF